MDWRERLVGILTSRWMQGLYFVLLWIAVFMRKRGWWIAAAVAAGLLIASLLTAALPALYRMRRAWKDFPHTPEYEEYACKKRKELEKDDKNTIKLE